MNRSVSPRPTGWSAWRPDPCLDLELQESFYGRALSVRWVQDNKQRFLGDQPTVTLGSSAGRPLDPCFFPDVIALIYRWISFWSGFRLSEVRAAFAIEVTHGRLIEVRAVPGHFDVPFIIASLRENGACLKPTLH